MRDARNCPAAAAGADNGKGLAVKLKSNQPLDAEVAVAHARMGLRNMAHQSEQQREDMLRHAVRRIAGNTHDRQPEAAGGGKVDIVEAGCSQCNKLRALVS